ncbi:MAG TPA: PEGA domain-containing protein [Blastocatellia bacterium]|nr:PEGA domain-containing protein [Blastocatellia bacterium]
MKCISCHNEYRWRSTCPKCQIPLLSAGQETIYEPEVAGKRRSTFLSLLRVGVFAVALTGLTTVSMLNYVSGGRQQEQGNRATSATAAVPSSPKAASASPAVSPTASPEARQASSRPLTADAKPEGVVGKPAAGEEKPLAERAGTDKPGRPERVLTVSPPSAPNGENGRTAISTAAAGKMEMVADNSSTAPKNLSKASEPAAVAAAPAPETESAAEISLEPLDKTLSHNTGLVTLNSYTRARIYIDGQYSGTTPRTVRLLAGEHSITLIADGYEEWSKKIRLNGRQQMGLMASMNKKAQPR